MQFGLMSAPSLVAMAVIACAVAGVADGRDEVVREALHELRDADARVAEAAVGGADSAGFGFTSSPPLAPHECMTCGQSWPDVPGGGLVGGTHSTVYGSAGAVMAATRIVLSGSCGFSDLMSLMNLLTGVSVCCCGLPLSFETAVRERLLRRSAHPGGREQRRRAHVAVRVLAEVAELVAAVVRDRTERVHRALLLAVQREELGVRRRRAVILVREKDDAQVGLGAQEVGVAVAAGRCRRRPARDRSRRAGARSRSPCRRGARCTGRPSRSSAP